MIRWHAPEEMLVEYAAGVLREPMALLVATHLALCAECRAAVADYERVGGAILETVEPETLGDDALARTLALLDSPAPAEPVPAASIPAEAGASLLPRPLRDYVAGPLASLRWKARGAGLAQVDLLSDFPGYTTRLLRIRAQAAMPRHTHHGTELTLVLAGGFSDAAGHYGRGDVATADAAVNHQPVADPGEDCFCLAVTDAPLRLTGPIGRHLNFLIRY